MLRFQNLTFTRNKHNIFTQMIISEDLKPIKNLLTIKELLI